MAHKSWNKEGVSRGTRACRPHEQLTGTTPVKNVDSWTFGVAIGTDSEDLFATRDIFLPGVAVKMRDISPWRRSTTTTTSENPRVQLPAS